MGAFRLGLGCGCCEPPGPTPIECSPCDLPTGQDLLLDYSLVSGFFAGIPAPCEACPIAEGTTSLAYYPPESSSLGAGYWMSGCVLTSGAEQAVLHTRDENGNDLPINEWFYACGSIEYYLKFLMYCFNGAMRLNWLQIDASLSDAETRCASQAADDSWSDGVSLSDDGSSCDPFDVSGHANTIGVPDNCDGKADWTYAQFRVYEGTGASFAAQSAPNLSSTRLAILGCDHRQPIEDCGCVSKALCLLGKGFRPDPEAPGTVTWSECWRCMSVR